VATDELLLLRELAVTFEKVRQNDFKLQTAVLVFSTYLNIYTLLSKDDEQQFTIYHCQPKASSRIFPQNDWKFSYQETSIRVDVLNGTFYTTHLL
jgi:hypothetical protein